MRSLAFADDQPRTGALPRSQDGEPSGPATVKTGRRALVADDEALIRWSVAETLSDMGMDVHQTADAASTLEAIGEAAEDFDVVILDLRMPDVDDLSLLTQVRRLLPSATMILMTAYGTPEIVAGAHLQGVRAVLSKPFELDHLRRLLGPDDTPVS